MIILRASRIGDFINASPAFRALREALPKAELSLITLPMLNPLAERLGYFDHLIPFPGYPGLAEQFFNPAQALAFFQQMQAEHFDLAIQMQGSGVYSNPFMLMLGAQLTAGFVRPGDPPGRLDAALPFPEGHEAFRNLSLVQFLGLPVGEPRPEFPLWPEDRLAASQLLKDLPSPWMGIHTSARDQTRRWPIERFAGAAAALHKKFGGTIVLIGEEQDRPALEAVFQTAGISNVNLAGCTSLAVTGAVIEQLSVFLTNDTGPAHMAYALNTPTVTIFGGGEPARNGPVVDGPFQVLAHPVPCRPCETGSCPIEFYCLDHITVDQVVSAAGQIIRL